jgi:hypothetical protein
MAIVIEKQVFWVDQCLNQILLDAWSFFGKGFKMFRPQYVYRVREKSFGLAFFQNFKAPITYNWKWRIFYLKNWHSFVWLQIWRFPPINKIMMMLVIEFHIWHLIFECKLSWFLNGSTIWSFCYSNTTLEMRYSKAIAYICECNFDFCAKRSGFTPNH